MINRFRQAESWLEEIARSRNERDIKNMLRCLPKMKAENDGDEGGKEKVVKVCESTGIFWFLLMK
jgi:hypothetical protein